MDKPEAKTLRISKTVIIDGIKQKFPKLAITDLYSVCDGLKAEEEAKAKKLAGEMKVGGYELFNLVHDIRRRNPSVNEVLVYTKSPKGAVEVLTVSLKKSGMSDPDIKELVQKIDVVEAIYAAEAVILETEEEPPAQEGSIEQSPLPESPSTSGATPTPEPVGYGSHLTS